MTAIAHLGKDEPPSPFWTAPGDCELLGGGVAVAADADDTDADETEARDTEAADNDDSTEADDMDAITKSAYVVSSRCKGGYFELASQKTDHSRTAAKCVCVSSDPSSSWSARFTTQ